MNVEEEALWPKKVKLVTANDMTRGDYSRGSRCCAMGHLIRETRSPAWFAIPLSVRRDFTIAYLQAASELGHDGRNVHLINDRCKNNKQRAEILNRTWEILGYTEDA